MLSKSGVFGLVSGMSVNVFGMRSVHGIYINCGGDITPINHSILVRFVNLRLVIALDDKIRNRPQRVCALSKEVQCRHTRLVEFIGLTPSLLKAENRRVG